MSNMRTRAIQIATVVLCQFAICVAGLAQATEGKRFKKPSIKEFNNWPAGTSPQEIGKRVAERYLQADYLNLRRTPPTPTIIYPEACTWYGALTFAQLMGDSALTSRLIQRFDPLLGDRASLVPKPNHVDNTVFAAVPFEIYIEAKDRKYLEMGTSLADQQWQNPGPDGLTTQTRFWIDDMYMITAAQVQAYRATGDKKYLDHAAREMSVYLDKLQQPNGLFYHAPDVPFFWGRCDGWVAAGMAETLRELPKDHPQRARILKGYTTMMGALLQFQGKDGMWRQLIDHEEAWPESSSSGMFTFAMITGVKNGWLDARTYGPAARRAWIAVTGYVDQNSDVTSVCEGTSKKDNLEYYFERRRKTGDYHGQAPMLWAATALLR